MATKRILVTYTAQFTKEIEVESQPHDDLLSNVYSDEIADIDPNEGDYIEDSFEVESVRVV